jgi:hypothetical protein
VTEESAPDFGTLGLLLNPLTGLPAADPALLDRRPLAIKISNYPRDIRPQYGLNEADVVFEYYIEWGYTRFIGIFYGNDATQIGPVRSGRYFDEHITRMYQAYYVSTTPIRVSTRTTWAATCRNSWLFPGTVHVRRSSSTVSAAASWMCATMRPISTRLDSRNALPGGPATTRARISTTRSSAAIHLKRVHLSSASSRTLTL